MDLTPSIGCFVAIPHEAEFEAVRRAVYEALEKSGVERVEFVSVSPNRWTSPSSVTSDIVERADFVIADVTSQSANVIYELGIADALRKPKLIMAQHQVPLPFDLANDQLLLYRPGEETKLTEYLRSWVRDVIERQRQRNVVAS